MTEKQQIRSAACRAVSATDHTASVPYRGCQVEYAALSSSCSSSSTTSGSVTGSSSSSWPPSRPTGSPESDPTAAAAAPAFIWAPSTRGSRERSTHSSTCGRQQIQVGGRNPRQATDSYLTRIITLHPFTIMTYYRINMWRMLKSYTAQDNYTHQT